MSQESQPGQGEGPLVSIVIPVYNDAHTIEDCLNSLLAQTYHNKEVIMVNDGSTDASAEIAQSIFAQHPFARMITIPRSGISRSRNIGIENARGKIIFFGEGDAVYDPDYLKKAMDCMEADPSIAGVCVSGAPLKTRSTFATESIDVENMIRRRLLAEGKLDPFYAWVLRKDALKSVGCFDPLFKQAEDKDVFLRLRKQGYRFGLVTGVNWMHLRNENTTVFMQKCYIKSKTRVLYILKHHKVDEILKGVGLFWALVASMMLGLVFNGLLHLTLLVIALGLMYALIKTLVRGWKCVDRKKYLFSLPLFQSLRLVCSAIGYTHGIAKLLFLRMVGRKVDWSVLE